MTPDVVLTAGRHSSVATMLVATTVTRRPRSNRGCLSKRGRPWNAVAVRVDQMHTGPHAGVDNHPLPVLPAGLLRSEPAAGPFKAAIAPRSGRNPADLGKAGPRPAQGPVKNWPPLVRKPTSLAWQGPDPEASSFRRFLLTAPAGKHGRGPITWRASLER